MATIKSFTDLSQSKTLSKILPLESADMMWKKELKYRICSDEHKVSESDFIYYPIFKEEKIIMSNFDVPCWSLAALLCVLPQSITKYIEGESCQKTFHLNLFRSYYHCVSYSFTSSVDDDNTLYCIGRDNWVDACVAMIEKLHELNLLYMIGK